MREYVRCSDCKHGRMRERCPLRWMVHCSRAWRRCDLFGPLPALVDLYVSDPPPGPKAPRPKAPAPEPPALRTVGSIRDALVAAGLVHHVTELVIDGDALLVRLRRGTHPDTRRAVGAVVIGR